MELISDRHPLIVVVGSGGVGKTTLAAAMGVLSARSGRATLVMTFDPSLRLKDALGVGEEAREREVPVDLSPLAAAGMGAAGGGGRPAGPAAMPPSAPPAAPSTASWRATRRTARRATASSATASTSTSRA